MFHKSDLRNKRILVVEDVEMNQYLARHIMESWGCVVEVAENGSVAVERVNQTDFDLVLMDIQMPVMDGIEATKQIRSIRDPFKAEVPIVALTANAMRSECDHYLQIGMNDWLGKPFQEPALLRTVSKNIRKISEDTFEMTSNNVVAEAAPAMQPKLYDMAMVEAISGGDESFVKKMLQLFLDTVPATLSDIQATSDAGDWSALSKHAHKLKSTIDSMNIASLKQTVREIEAGGKAGQDPGGLRSRVAQVMEVMGRVMEDVRGEI